MGKSREVLPDDHARALIKQAIGMIFGEPEIVTEAATEIAAIEAQHTTAHTKPAKVPPMPLAVETTSPFS
jgi:ATP-dependent protease ClpP protease subunit